MKRWSLDQRFFLRQKYCMGLFLTLLPSPCKCETGKSRITTFLGMACLMWIMSFTCYAVDAPILTFEKQVEIVVAAQKDPNILQVKIDQKNDHLEFRVMVDRHVDRQKAKEIVQDMIYIAKTNSLDDRPASRKELGKGLYHYKVVVTRADGIELGTGIKLAKNKTFSFRSPVALPQPVQVKPWTLEDASALSRDANQ